MKPDYFQKVNMTQCEKSVENQERCNCSYDPCPRKGQCCACLQYHLAMSELPACAFPDAVERTYDRSFRRFVQLHRQG